MEAKWKPNKRFNNINKKIWKFGNLEIPGSRNAVGLKLRQKFLIFWSKFQKKCKLFLKFQKINPKSRRGNESKDRVNQ